ncbi:MAG TPA: DUF4381 domain-containing protein, partial [Gammaproteobacteria bacterium]|nr:DUF4381 domain-containing protein [Gammaproteobacteria bacterium]
MNPSADYSKLPLHDIHLPAAVGWWPPAPGWWVLALLVIGGLACASLLYYLRRRRRAALRAIGRVAAALAAGEEPVLCMQRLSTLLRRFAMTSASRSEAAHVAGLTGGRWLEYLDSRWSGNAFARAGALLLAAPYAPPH